MPYIDPKKRIDIDAHLVTQIRQMPNIETKGDLEYIIFALMKKYMSSREYKYSTLHDCVYSVAHVSDEFRRRYLDKREDQARETNGDVE